MAHNDLTLEQILDQIKEEIAKLTAAVEANAGQTEALSSQLTEFMSINRNADEKEQDG